jgi:FlaA1/EpsC-like NDP-sugar epimerase
MRCKKVLITGAGSIGEELLNQLLAYKDTVYTIRVFDNSEIKLHNLRMKHRDEPRVELFLGDVRDKDAVKKAVNGCDIIFNTAAYKHVSFCEENPIEAVKTNIFGLQNIINASSGETVKKIINISTDKAANPISVMGATKLITERLIENANRRTDDMVFINVRFGNVIASNGSVVEVFREQIKRKRNLTVTDPEMTRFIMSIKDAVRFILHASEICKGGEVFILKMPSIKLIDLVEAISGNKTNIDIIGRSKIEKVHEVLITEEEMDQAYEGQGMIVIPPKEHIEYYRRLGFKKLENIVPSSDKATMLTVDEIKKLLE